MKRMPFALWLFLGHLAATSAQQLDLVCNEKLAEQAVAQMVLTEIYRKSGLDLKVTPLPPVRATAETTRGQHDGEVARIESYAAKYPSLLQVKPAYYHLTTSAFALKSSKIVLQTQADLSKYRVAIINGVAHSADATSVLKSVDKVTDADSMFKMLTSGRVDVVLDTGINGAYEIRKLGLTNVVEVGILAKLDLYHYVHEKNRSLVPLLEATISRLSASGELARMVTRAEQAFLAQGVIP